MEADSTGSSNVLCRSQARWVMAGNTVINIGRGDDETEAAEIERPPRA